MAFIVVAAGAAATAAPPRKPLRRRAVRRSGALPPAPQRRSSPAPPRNGVLLLRLHRRKSQGHRNVQLRRDGIRSGHRLKHRCLARIHVRPETCSTLPTGSGMRRIASATAPGLDDGHRKARENPAESEPKL